MFPGCWLSACSNGEAVTIHVITVRHAWCSLPALCLAPDCAEQLYGSICEFQDWVGHRAWAQMEDSFSAGILFCSSHLNIYPDSSLVLPPAPLLPIITPWEGNALHSGHLSSVTEAWILTFLAHRRPVSNTCWPSSSRINLEETATRIF